MLEVLKEEAQNEMHAPN